MVADSIHMLMATRKGGRRRRGEESEGWGKEKVKKWRKRWRRRWRRKKKRGGGGVHSDNCVCQTHGNKDPFSIPALGHENVPSGPRLIFSHLCKVQMHVFRKTFTKAKHSLRIFFPQNISSFTVSQ